MTRCGARRRGRRAAALLAACGLALTAAAGAAGAAGRAEPAAALGHDAPRATTEAGVFEGTTAGGVASFLGIAYAAPPIGALRWRAPQPVAAQAGIRPATVAGADCMQQPMMDPEASGGARAVSEDCLVLNVWTPAGRARTPCPVMVWIHGGAFIMGSGGWPLYDGANLARRGVVLVTINYRLGRFGFFAHPALTRDNADGLLGNYGLMDQLAALRWVRRNIAAFGGDARNVTVFGESAGAHSVNALLTSPLARGLFDKAVSQSGGGQKRFRLADVATPDVSLPDAEARGLAWARKLGVADDDLAGLRGLPADALLNVLPPERGEAPIVDGRVLPQPVDVAFLRGLQTPMPYLVGANSNEQSLARWLPGVIDEAVAALGAHRDEVLSLYTQAGAVDMPSAAAAFWGEQAMVGPARFLARRMSATGAPTWLYRYSHVPATQRGRVQGAGHSAEVGLVFGNQATVHAFGISAADDAVADTMASAWVRFATTGNPNAPGQATWPRYRQDRDELLDFSDAGPVVRSRFAADRLDVLDRVYLENNGLVERQARSPSPLK